MKKMFVFFIILLSTASQVLAEALMVESLTKFSTDNYPSNVKMKALSEIELAPDVLIKEGYVLSGKLVDVSSPKRLKRNATFSFMPISYIDNSGNIVHIKEPFIGKYSAKFDLDKGQIAKSAALTVGNHFVKGVSMGFYAVEGAVKNEDGNRVKSSAVSVYKNSPLSYVEKGQDIEISAHDIFALKFHVEEEEEPVQTQDGSIREGNFEYKPLNNE